MKKWMTIGISILSILSLSAFSTGSNPSISKNQIKPNDITAVINKNTTAKELEDLKKFFAESDIELLIDNIEFNDQEEIKSLSIVLKKGASKSKYSSSSNQAISDLELGFKNGNLYITNSGVSDITAWKNQININHQNFDMDSILKSQNFAFHHGIDSILKNQNFAFNFDLKKNGDSIFFNGKHFDIGKLKDQITGSFKIEEDENGNYIFNGQQLPSNFRNNKKFSFVDDPSIEKLIIIDGKTSNFKKLDELAKSDKLDSVDFLKSKTAMSIYGDKAKDGAIIAITKK